MQTTEDALLGGRVRVRQPAEGYRVNADTVLLAAAVESGARLMEAGCGVGGALLCAAARLPDAHFTGVERDPAFAALARENAAALGDRARIVEADALSADLGTFDGVFSNPPYDQAGEGRAFSPAWQVVHVADAPLDSWIAALSNRLRGGAALTLIHRAAKLPEILAAFEGRLGGIEVTPIRPRAGAPAKRVLVRARKGSRAPLALYAGLDLHGGEGRFTPEAAAIFDGEAAVAWR